MTAAPRERAPNVILGRPVGLRPKKTAVFFISNTFWIRGHGPRQRESRIDAEESRTFLTGTEGGFFRLIRTTYWLILRSCFL